MPENRNPKLLYEYKPKGIRSQERHKVRWKGALLIMVTKTSEQLDPRC